MSSTMVTGSVNARTVRLSAPTAQLQPVRFLGSRQPLQRHQSKALFAKRRAGQVVAKAATEEKPDVAKVGDPPFLLELCGVHRIAMTVTLQPSFCREVSQEQHFRVHVPAYLEAAGMIDSLHRVASDTIVVFAVRRQHWSANR